jgi:hypothetical protein
MMSDDNARGTAPERVLRLEVCEIYRSFGNAYAADAHGHRFLVTQDSRGVDFAHLELGQTLHNAHVTSRNYVVSVG